MGLGSFGRKPNPPKKKRKLVDTNSEGSGSNTQPLGVRLRVLGGGHGNGNGNGQGDEAQDIKSEQAVEAQTMENASDPQPNPPPHLQPPFETKPSSPTINKAVNEPASPRPIHHLPNRPPARNSGLGQGYGMGEAEMAMRPPRTLDGRKADGQWDWWALKKGVVDERGDVAFYCGSFVEDPWGRLRGGGGRGRGE